MKSIRRMMRQVRAMFSGGGADAEMERELAAHLLLLEDEMMRKGATPAEARGWRGSSWAEWSRCGSCIARKGDFPSWRRWQRMCVLDGVN